MVVPVGTNAYVALPTAAAGNGYDLKFDAVVGVTPAGHTVLSHLPYLIVPDAICVVSGHVSEMALPSHAFIDPRMLEAGGHAILHGRVAGFGHATPPFVG